ncbi:n-acetyltransferase domain-containing protein [Trichonephila clavata]|uniref:N-acetyltransferase domain-containing protein n=1 Tax=Trichonephila clavata TaxID=2740835 RepID=A0A8X6FMC4_TRICU|nr:n-acetyltransferase domain-containing protein [Trichonephila clavata]
MGQIVPSRKIYVYPAEVGVALPRTVSSNNGKSEHFHLWKIRSSKGCSKRRGGRKLLIRGEKINIAVRSVCHNFEWKHSFKAKGEMESTIRNATPMDLPSILELVKSVNRMVGSDEIQSWMLKDPQALFLAEISNQTDARKELAGLCCGTILDSDLGFMGLYMVKEDMRGKGVGFKLWKATKEHIGDRNIGVCGKMDYIVKYREKEGFEHIQDYVIKYYECFGDCMPTGIAWPSEVSVATFFDGKLFNYRKNCDNVILVNNSNEIAGKRDDSAEAESIGSVRIETLLDEKTGKICFDKVQTLQSSSVVFRQNYNFESVDGAKEKKLIKSVNEAEFSDIRTSIQNTSANQASDISGICLIAEEILSKVVQYDKSLHSRDRSMEVRQIFALSSCKSSVALVSGQVVGYGCLRPVLTGHWIISPLYSDSESIAETILFDLLQGFDFGKVPEGVVTRLPDKNIFAENLFHKFGFSEIENEHIVTSFTKRPVKRDISRIYSFHSTVFCSE